MQRGASLRNEPAEMALNGMPLVCLLRDLGDRPRIRRSDYALWLTWDCLSIPGRPGGDGRGRKIST